MNTKLVDRSLLVKKLRFVIMLCLALCFVLGSPIVSATHVQLNILSLFQPTATTQIVDGETTGPIYQLQVTPDPHSPSHSTATGKLLGVLDVVPVGKRAVQLIGFTTDILLLNAEVPQIIDINPDPVDVDFRSVQNFTVDFYTDPIHNGFDPQMLLQGFSTTSFQKIVDNTCPISGDDCVSAPDGFFDLTSEIGNYPDTLRIVVSSDVDTFLIPEPGNALLFIIGMLALSVSRRYALK